MAFMERYTVREREGAVIVRVMTIHKSKGLGFDVVLLPDIEGNRLDQARDGLAVHQDPERSVAWVLDMPPKIFCEADAILAGQVRETEAAAGYEALSLLYVAMTRAKRAMYLIAAPAGESASRNYRRILTDTLGAEAGDVRVGASKFAGSWSMGDPDWQTKLAEGIKPTRTVREIEQPRDLEPSPARLIARRPSSELRLRRNAMVLFAPEAAAGSEFGSAVHHLFSEVEWNGSDLLAEWMTRAIPDSVLHEVSECLRAPELNDVWAKPQASAQVELWRERAFEVVLDNSWVTGVFDRVVVRRDATGRALGATVYDFKTDRFAEDQIVAAVARHTGQLNLYRRVTAVLTGLNVGSIAGELIFTQYRRSVPIPECVV